MSGLIYELIPKVMEEVPVIPKERKHGQQHWMYRGFEDFLAYFRPALLKHGLFVVPEVLGTEVSDKQTDKGATMRHVIATVAYSVYAPDGSMIRSVVIGESWDNQDNASTKALDDAFTSFLTQVFCVPTGETPGRQTQTSQGDRQTQQRKPAAAPADPLPPPANNLGEKELDDRAERFVREDGVARVEGGYKVTVNPRISYMVTRPGEKLVCGCERFKAMNTGNHDFRCEHIRAVSIYFQQKVKDIQKADTSQPAITTGLSSDQLVLQGIVSGLLSFAVPPAWIDKHLERVCDGISDIEKLAPAQAAKAISVLQRELEAKQSAQRQKGSRAA